jgi:hypothetical protein
MRRKLPSSLASNSAQAAACGACADARAGERPCGVYTLDQHGQRLRLLCALDIVEHCGAARDQKRSEDAIIAYSWDKYLRAGDETWPALPMRGIWPAYTPRRGRARLRNSSIDKSAYWMCRPIAKSGQSICRVTPAAEIASYSPRIASAIANR